VETEIDDAGGDGEQGVVDKGALKGPEEDFLHDGGKESCIGEGLWHGGEEEGHVVRVLRIEFYVCYSKRFGDV
jgi:hypothetical protein